MKKLILTVAIFLSALNAQAKSIQEIASDLSVLGGKAAIARDNGRLHQACFYAGQFATKAENFIEKAREHGVTDTTDIQRILRAANSFFERNCN